MTEPARSLNCLNTALRGSGTVPAIVSTTNRVRGPETRTIAMPAGNRPLDKATIVSENATDMDAPVGAAVIRATGLWF
jgi:hypothetical protein